MAVSLYVHLPYRAQETASLKSSTISDSYSVPASLSSKIPERGESVTPILHLGLSTLVSYFLHVEQLWVPLSISVYCRKSLSEKGWERDNL